LAAAELASLPDGRLDLYIRNSWGNSASAVDAAAVKKERQALVERGD